MRKTLYFGGGLFILKETGSKPLIVSIKVGVHFINKIRVNFDFLSFLEKTIPVNSHWIFYAIFRVFYNVILTF